MSDESQSKAKFFKLMNPTDLSKMLTTNLPKTVIEKPQRTLTHTNYINSTDLEEKILSDYLIEHYQDIGGWKPREFVSVEPIQQIPNPKPYFPIEIQKFEIPEKNLPDKIFEPPEEPDYTKSIYSSLTESKFKDSKVSFKAKDLNEYEEKAKKLEDKLKCETGEDERERMIKLVTRNKKVYSIVDDLLARSSKRKTNKFLSK